MQDNPHFYYMGNFFNAENVPHLFFLKILNRRRHMKIRRIKKTSCRMEFLLNEIR